MINNKREEFKTPPFCAFLRLNIIFLIVFVIELLRFGE